jgi:hypothetical protein
MPILAVHQDAVLVVRPYWCETRPHILKSYLGIIRLCLLKCNTAIQILGNPFRNEDPAAAFSVISTVRHRHKVARSRKQIGNAHVVPSLSDSDTRSLMAYY